MRWRRWWSSACWACCRSPLSVPRNWRFGRRGYGWALASVTAWSVVVQVLRVVQAYVLDLGLGLTVPLAYYLLVMPLGLLVLLLPISVSGFGVPQGVIVWLLRPVGVTDAAAFALSTLIVLTGLAGNLHGLALWLRRPPLPATGA